jgi:2-oxoglutarate ferredoxin oxidoreductase subunit alpha
VVEMSVSGQFESLLREKTGIRCKASIRKYDGRPFDPVELGKRIREAV